MPFFQSDYMCRGRKLSCGFTIEINYNNSMHYRYSLYKLSLSVSFCLFFTWLLCFRWGDCDISLTGFNLLWAILLCSWVSQEDISCPGLYATYMFPDILTANLSSKSFISFKNSSSYFPIPCTHFYVVFMHDSILEYFCWELPWGAGVPKQKRQAHLYLQLQTGNQRRIRSDQWC